MVSSGWAARLELACAPGAAELLLAEPGLKPHEITATSYRTKAYEETANCVPGLLNQRQRWGRRRLGLF